MFICPSATPSFPVHTYRKDRQKKKKMSIVPSATPLHLLSLSRQLIQQAVVDLRTRQRRGSFWLRGSCRGGAWVGVGARGRGGLGGRSLALGGRGRGLEHEVRHVGHVPDHTGAQGAAVQAQPRGVKPVSGDKSKTV